MPANPCDPACYRPRARHRGWAATLPPPPTDLCETCRLGSLYSRHDRSLDLHPDDRRGTPHRRTLLARPRRRGPGRPRSLVAACDSARDSDRDHHGRLRCAPDRLRDRDDPRRQDPTPVRRRRHAGQRTKRRRSGSRSRKCPRGAAIGDAGVAVGPLGTDPAAVAYPACIKGGHPQPIDRAQLEGSSSVIRSAVLRTINIGNLASERLRDRKPSRESWVRSPRPTHPASNRRFAHIHRVSFSR